MKTLLLTILLLSSLIFIPVLTDVQYIGKMPPTSSFANIEVDGTWYNATSYDDFVKFIAGTNMTLSLNAVTGEITFASSGGGGGSLDNIHTIGNVTTIGCEVDEVLAVNTSAIWACKVFSVSGDNLGNHIATTFLNMSSFEIDDVSGINSSSSGAFQTKFINLDTDELIGWADDNTAVEHTIGVDFAGRMVFQVGSNEIFRFQNNFGSPLIQLKGNTSHPIFRTLFLDTTPTDLEFVSALQFQARNDAAQTVDYGQIRVRSENITDGLEDGAWNFFVLDDGALTNAMEIGTAGLGVILANNQYNYTVGEGAGYYFDKRILMDAIYQPIADQTTFKINNIDEYSFNATHFDLKGNTCVGCGVGGGDNLGDHIATQDLNMSENAIEFVSDIEFDDFGSITWDNKNGNIYTFSGTLDLFTNVATGGEHFFQVNDVTEYSFNATNFEMNNNQISGSMTATDNELLRYNATTDDWQPTLDIKSGNVASVADGGTSTVTFNTAFSSTPNVVATFSDVQSATDLIELSAISTTGFTINIDKGHGGGNHNHSVDWIATNAGDP